MFFTGRKLRAPSPSPPKKKEEDTVEATLRREEGRARGEGEAHLWESGARMLAAGEADCIKGKVPL